MTTRSETASAWGLQSNLLLTSIHSCDLLPVPATEEVVHLGL